MLYVPSNVLLVWTSYVQHEELATATTGLNANLTHTKKAIELVLCMYVHMYVCVYVRMYVCMHVYV